MTLCAGLTGGIACGKTEADLIFQELGAHLIDADRVARDLVTPETPVWQQIVVIPNDRSVTRSIACIPIPVWLLVVAYGPPSRQHARSTDADRGTHH